MSFDDNEMFNCHSPDADIICKDCANKIGKTQFSNDYRKISCKVFEWPKTKPIGILTNNENCEYYNQEK